MVRILAPLDGAQGSYEALERSLHLLDPSGLQVTILVVQPDGFEGANEDVRELLEGEAVHGIIATEAHLEEVVSKGQQIVQAHGIEAEVRKGHLSPEEEILAACATHDVLVMHELDSSRWAARWHGSNGGRIARKAGCHVFLVNTLKEASHST